VRSARLRWARRSCARRGEFCVAWLRYAGARRQLVGALLLGDIDVADRAQWEAGAWAAGLRYLGDQPACSKFKGFQGRCCVLQITSHAAVTGSDNVIHMQDLAFAVICTDARARRSTRRGEAIRNDCGPRFSRASHATPRCSLLAIFQRNFESRKYYSFTILMHVSFAHSTSTSEQACWLRAESAQ
jgi:hypothetical protein